MQETNMEEWAIINEREAFRPIGTRILVLEDEFKSGLECKTCDGTGHTSEKCSHCDGTGFWKKDPDRGNCPDCEVGTGPARKAVGYKLCPDCKGRQATIIIPDSAKRRPLTGKILAVGRDVKEFKPGSRVMYTNYTGTDFELRIDGEIIHLRVMLEHDAMTEYKQLERGSKLDELSSGRKEMVDAGLAV